MPQGCASPEGYKPSLTARRGSALRAGSHPREHGGAPRKAPEELPWCRAERLCSTAACPNEGHPRWSRDKRVTASRPCAGFPILRWLLGHCPWRPLALCTLSGGRGDRRRGGHGAVSLGVRKRAPEALTFLGDDRTPWPWRAEDKTVARWKRGRAQSGDLPCRPRWREGRSGMLEGPSRRRRPRGGLADPP